MILFETHANFVEGFVNAVSVLEIVEVRLADGAPADHVLEVENFVPVFSAIDEDQRVLRHFTGLRQGHHFPKFVEGAEAAGKDNEGFGDLREPQFAHEKIMEIEAELGTDVRIRELLVGQFDGKADRFAAGFIGAAIGSFHDAGPSAGTDNKAARARAERKRPRGDLVGELARLLVIGGHFESAFGFAEMQAMFFEASDTPTRRFQFFQPGETSGSGFMRLDARRAKHYYGVADSLLLKLHEGINVL